MQRPDNELQIDIRKFENPTFGYRRGIDGEIEKEIFDGNPPAGWAESPADVDGPHDAPEPAAEERWPAPPYAEHTFNVLRAEFMRRAGKGPPPSTNKPALIQMLEDQDKAQRFIEDAAEDADRAPETDEFE